MLDFLQVLLILLMAHAIADFPLQGDFLARAKNHATPMPGVPWQVALFAHVLIQGGLVMVVTGSMMLAVFEMVAHAFIDYAKNDGLLNAKGWNAFAVDQLLHAACKVLWVVFLVAGLA